MTLSKLILSVLACTLGAVGGVGAQFPDFASTETVTQYVFTTCGCREVLQTNARVPNFPTSPTNTSTTACSTAALTGVHRLAPSSPTSCYHLPTPTAALDVIAAAVDQAGDPDPPNTIFFYFGDNGAVPYYLGAVVDEWKYLLDISPEAAAAIHVGLILRGGQAVLFDQSGIYLFDANCTTVLAVTIENFWEQMLKAVSSSLRASNRLRTRQDLQRFTVELQLDDGVALSSPSMSFGFKECIEQGNTTGNGSKTLTFTCDSLSSLGTQACETNLANWLNIAPSSPSGKPANVASFLGVLSLYLAESNSSIASLFPTPNDSLLTGLDWMSTAQATALEAIQFSAKALCQQLHVDDSFPLVLADPAFGTSTLANFAAVPAMTITERLRAASAGTPSPTAPPRQGNPTDSMVSETVASFPGGIRASPSSTRGLNATLISAQSLSVTGTPLRSATESSSGGNSTGRLTPSQVQSSVEEAPTPETAATASGFTQPTGPPPIITTGSSFVPDAPLPSTSDEGSTAEESNTSLLTPTPIVFTPADVSSTSVDSTTISLAADTTSTAPQDDFSTVPFPTLTIV